MASKAVAEGFVKEKLGVKFIDNKSLYLNKIIRAFFEKVPNQNISTSILPAEDRFPSEWEVLEAGNSLRGGINVHNNWFLKLLLESLEYEVHFVGGKLHLPSSPAPRRIGSHFAIVVRDLEKEGDLHLVDVGSGSPVFKAVPLDRLPYTATDVNLTYRFVEESGQWHNEHKKDGDSWERFSTYDKTPVTGNPGDAFKEQVIEYLRDDFVSGGITAIHFPQPGSSAIPDVPDYDKNLDYAIYIIDDQITFVNSADFKWSEQIPEDQWVQTIADYFPSIPKNDVRRKLEIMGERARHMMY